MSFDIKLMKDEECESIDSTKYRGMIGSLLYLTASRPDIMFSVCLCDRFQEAPKTSHREAVKRIFCYIKGTRHLGLWYPNWSGIETVVYVDSDHARDYVDRKSTSSICTFVGCCLTSWFSKKQTALAISTTEAEYVSVGKACQEALGMKQALIDYDVRLDNVPIMCDNKDAIDLSKNPVQHSRTKHIEICHHFLCDNVQKGHISIKKVPSIDNITDILTKTLKRCCLTSWFSKKQTALAISTIEAEYVCTRKAFQQAVRMKQALIDYDIRLDDVPIMCDNKGAIDLSRNPMQHSWTKHIEIHHHFLQDNVQKGNISIEKVSFEDNIAEILTKPLKRESFSYLCLDFGMMEHIPASTSTNEDEDEDDEPNGKLIHNSIINGPSVRRMIPEPGDTNREIPVNETFHVQTNDELTEKELKQIEVDNQAIQTILLGLPEDIYAASSRLLRYAKSRSNGKLIHNSIINGPYVRRMILNQIEADDQAIQTILLGLPEDIYAAVDSCETAQEIWFTSNERESIESYYHRFLKLMNDLKQNKHFSEKIASNLKFLNNLQPKWSRHVTIVHQTKDLHKADYTQLYDFLKYNQKEVDELKVELLVKIQYPLALMANSNKPYAFPAPHQDQPSYSQNYMQQPMPNPKDITDPTTVMNMALALMAKAFKLNYSTPTNNNQRISSNPRNRQIAQPGMNMGQDRKMQMVGGEEVDQTYVLFPVWSDGSTNPQNNDKDAEFDGKEHDFDAKKPESVVILSSSSSAQTKKQDDKTKKEDKGKSHVESFTRYRDLNAEFEDCSANSSNEVNAAGSTVPTVGQNSLNSTNTFSATGPSNTEEPKRVHQALKDPSWIKAMQKELLQFKMQKVWVLVDLPYGKRAIGTK
nr:hypothetical protein [Tanacetum cinerariifolium]